MSEKIKILIVGTGAIGSFYGGKLSQGGADVSALCRSDYEIVKNHGIDIKSTFGDFIFKPEHVVKDINEYPYNPDYIMVTTKVLPHINISDIIKNKVAPNTVIFLLQNGIDIEKDVVKNFPNNEIISGLAFICVSRIAHGKIDHQDYGKMAIGKYPEGISSAVKKLAKLFQNSGLDCQISEDIIASRWKKMIWNAPFNPISVLTGGADTREMIQSKETLHVVKKIMEEVFILAEKTGHPIPAEIIEQNIRDTEKMTPYKTSMLLDYENGREMEVEAILGNALRIAEKYKVKLPYMETIYGTLSLLNKKNTL